MKLSGINIPPNRTTYYTYDNRNRQIKVTDANGGETNYSYYKDGKTASIKDAVGNKTEYTYDVAGRLTKEILGSLSREYKYDLVNNRIKTTDRNGRTTNYEYDNLNRIKTEAWADNSKTFTYSYDKNGNRLTADDGKIKYVNSYDKTDLLETVDRFDDGNPNPKVRFNYEYDEIGNLTQTKEIVGTAVTTTLYEYDDPRYLNTKITQTGAGLANKAVKFTYNTKGENTKIERYLDGLLKVTTDNAYDIYGRLIGIAQVKGITPANPTGTPISNDAYVLDSLNRLQTQTKGGQVKEIGYDKTDQVQTVTGGAGEAYTYDLNGNRTNGGYATGVDNRLTSDGTYSYLYDPEGNRQSRTNIVTNAVDEYTWDYRNRLTGIVSKTSSTGTITQTVSYEYDVDDQRVSKTVTSTTLNAGTSATGSTTEKYYLDGNQIAFVTDGSGNRTEHYLYGLNVDQVLAQDSPAGMVWALADRLGSIETITDGEGVVVDKRTFDSFGRVLSETNPSVSFRYGYTGRELDLESGLDYYRARYYDSQVGRFISVDPMGFGAGDTNLYRYVGNSSTNAIDSTGMSWELPASWNDNLYAADKYIAGVADLASFGATTSIRNSLYGDKVVGQHEGELFTAGQWTGAALMTAVGLGSLRTAGFASSFVGNAAKAGLGGAGFGAVAGAGMSVLNDLDHGGVNGDSFGKALSWGAQGAIGGFKFGSQYGAAGGFGLAGQAIQLRMLVDGAAQGTMSAIDHFRNGEYWSGAGELAGAFFAAKAAGEHGGRLVADYQSAMGRMPQYDGRMYAFSQGAGDTDQILYDPSNAHKLLAKHESITLELFGAKRGQLNNSINVDIVAERGIKVDLLNDKLSFIPDNSVDRVVTFNPHIPGEVGGTGLSDYLPEVARVLKPGGEIVISGTKGNKFTINNNSRLEYAKSLGFDVIGHKDSLPQEFSSFEFKTIGGEILPHSNILTTILRKSK